MGWILLLLTIRWREPIVLSTIRGGEYVASFEQLRQCERALHDRGTPAPVTEMSGSMTCTADKCEFDKVSWPRKYICVPASLWAAPTLTK